MRGLVLVLVGFCAIAIGLFFIVPTVVNFPETWFGIIVIVLFLTVGIALIYRGVRYFVTGNKKTSSSP
mgnify:CR=1 FL=1